MNKIIIKSVFTLLIVSNVSCRNVSEGESSSEEETMLSQSITMSSEQYQNLGVDLVDMTKMAFSAEIALRGMVDVPPENIAEVSSAVPGIIKSMTHNVLPGKYVKKGAVLATAHSMELVQLQQDYLEAFLKKEILHQELMRQKELMDGGAGVLKKMQLAESDLKLNQAKVAGLAAKLKIANVNIEKVEDGKISPQLYIYAPFSGFVKDVHVNTGTSFSTSDVLFELISKEHLHVELTVFEKDAPYLKNGQKVHISGTNIPEGLIGSIFLISKSFDEASKAINVHVHLDDESKEEQLTPGQFVEAKIQMVEKMANVLPESALIRESEGNYVLVKKQDEFSFDKMAVEIGESKNGMVEIISPSILKDVAVSKVHLISGMSDSGE
ncbi:MAG: cobalt-zinc-cadmium efflux system membrane fusion protein [Arcticibacterium sp.]|jgi:cobalt-zinc-cadmium efflux system membrane fusion protein